MGGRGDEEKEKDEWMIDWREEWMRRIDGWMDGGREEWMARRKWMNGWREGRSGMREGKG